MLASQCRGSPALSRLSIFRSRRPLRSASACRIRSLVTSQDARPRSGKSKSSHGAPSDRKLATAIGEMRSTGQPAFDLPPPGASSTLEPLPVTFNPTDVLQIPYPEAPVVQRAMRISSKGISGNMDEVGPVFDACLRVGKLDRARLFIERLTANLTVATPEQMIDLHDRYLRACVNELQVDPNSERAEDINTWYEMFIRQQNLPVTAVTVACMIKIAILSSQGSQLDARINRYMETIDHDTRFEVLTIADILTAADLSLITKASPGDYNVDEEGAVERDLERLAGSEALPSPDIPQISPAEQEGSGLRALQKSLAIFSQIPDGHDFRSLTLDEMRELQSRLERDSLDAAIESWRKLHQENIKRGFIDASQMFGTVLYNWHVELEAALKFEWVAIAKAEKSARTKIDQDRCLYGPLLQTSTPERVAAAAIICVVNILSASGIEKGTPINLIVHQLGRLIEEDAKSQHRARGRNAKPARRTLPEVLRRHWIRSQAQKSAKAKDTAVPPKETAEAPKEMAEAPKETAKPTKETAEAPKQAPEHTKETAGPLQDMKDKDWPPNIRAKLAGMLIHRMLHSCTIKAVKEHPETKEFVSQQQPAFAQGFVFKKGKKNGTLLANPELVNMMMREPRPELLVRQLPMIVPPDPWSKYDKGGYLDTPTRFIRAKAGEVDQKIYAEAAIARGDIGPLFKGLDILGKTPWKINHKVLNVMVSAWNTGKAIAGIPPLEPQISIPPEPAETGDPLVRRAWYAAVKKVQNEKSGLRSNRCFINYQLEIARAFRNHTIYFPHNLDFRGRAYPIPPLLNHMGADHARGILMFGKGKRLGKTGLRWLKVHLANVYGFDKASLKEREDFAMTHLADIEDSVANPLGGRRWWLEGEDPWQTLATCFELKDALDSGDPEEFVSHLPVHQDGTCNGLQHYAALGGDEWGARQVNLEPGDRPADVYTAVADLVKTIIKQDEDQGHELAPWLHDKIKRKVVKQTVMTNVYGVTFAGARAQILKQLDDLYPKLQVESGVPAAWFSAYIAKCVFQALGTMFSGAHDIQYWLGECASRICRSLGPDQLEALSELPLSEIGGSSNARSMPIEIKTRLRNTLVWTTPLRLPVAQPYRQVETKSISTCLQELAVPTVHRTHPVNRRKQLQGFPPNFIHSLDATHMLLSAIRCDEQGLSFAAVHDSFWTHACDVDAMSSILRDAFVRIHSEDVIGRLRAEFVARYGGSLYLGYVNDRSPAGKEVQAWRKANRMSLLSEGVLEYKRQRLLASDEAAQVQIGKNIVTPASIAEKHGDPHNPTVEDGDIAALGSLKDAQPEKDAAGAVETGEAEAETTPENGDHDDVLHVADGAARAEETEPLESEEASPESTSAGPIIKRRKPPSANKPVRRFIWLPIEFPAVPQKGEFNVKRLLESRYFFS